MFFRRRKAKIPTFEQRIASLGANGFVTVVETPDRARVERGPCVAVVQKNGLGAPDILRPGFRIGGETGVIADAGNQKFLLTPSGRKLPALATHLEALHAFLEDLRAALGVESLYHDGLGTINELHNYDRLKGRGKTAP